MRLYLDIETRSGCDLTFHGLRRYAMDPSTEAICMAYCFDDEPMRFWWLGEPFPQEVIDHFKNGGEVWAHNAQFERELFEFVIGPDHDFDAPRLEQWRCSMVVAQVNGHPASLGELGRSLGLPVSKQDSGTRLIREYCAPIHKDIFDPEYTTDKNLMREYCSYDVEVMRIALKCMRNLTADEWAEYHLNEKINDKGIPIDVEFCRAALKYSDELREEAGHEIRALTEGLMKNHNSRKGRDLFLENRLEEHHRDACMVFKKGEKKFSFDKDRRDALLEFDDLDIDVRALIEHINNAGSSTLAKYGTAVNTHVNGLVHHTFNFHGAQTGRFTGRGLQPHNIRRDAYDVDEADRLIEDIVDNYEVPHAGHVLGRLLRSMITHQEGVYFVDWSAIEGRVAPWLSDSELAEDRLQVFRDNGDIYVESAKKMFTLTEVNDDERQQGKIAELSLGYGGGKGALMVMASKYGKTFEPEKAEEIVQLWRSSNPWAVDVWEAFETAAEKAVRVKDKPIEAGRCTFEFDGYYLWLTLPSGHKLAYPKAEYEQTETVYGTTFEVTFQTTYRPAAGSTERIRKHLRGALAFQNAVQATAAQILRRALVLADKAGLDIRLHCHDEIMGVGPRSDGDRLNEIMLTVPDWAEGLPLATGGVKWQARYGK